MKARTETLVYLKNTLKNDTINPINVQTTRPRNLVQDHNTSYIPYRWVVLAQKLFFIGLVGSNTLHHRVDHPLFSSTVTNLFTAIFVEVRSGFFIASRG
jgi:hypothetical protein